jgi:hypothetical protein
MHVRTERSWWVLAFSRARRQPPRANGWLVSKLSCAEDSAVLLRRLLQSYRTKGCACPTWSEGEDSDQALFIDLSSGGRGVRLIKNLN